MNDEKRTNEVIKFNTELIKIIALVLTACGGGVVALIVSGLKSGREVVLAAFGMLFVMILIILGYSLYSSTKKLLDD